MKIVVGASVAAAILIGSVGGGVAQTTQPYSGQDRRAVKSLADDEMADLAAGRGMGFAKTAELNGYPGPTHAIEHAPALKLSPDQRNAIEAVRARMAEAARALGSEIIAREVELDGLFAGRLIDAAVLREKTTAIAALYGRLRNVHLAAHLETRRLLDAAQLAAYERLRGYGNSPTDRPGSHHPRQN